MSKIKIGGIVRHLGLTLIRFSSGPSQANTLTNLLKTLARAEINVQFIVHSIDPAGNHLVTLCVSREDQDGVLANLNALQSRNHFDSLHIEPGVSGLGVYGPDFRIRPRLAGAFMGALDTAGIPIHAISTSMSTFTVIISSDLMDAAQAALDQVFELP
jgi:aspartokinase